MDHERCKCDTVFRQRNVTRRHISNTVLQPRYWGREADSPEVCRWRSPYGPWPVFWYLRTIWLRISPYQNFRNCAVKMLRRFFANFCHEIGCENDQTYIFRFVKYLSTFFYTFLPVNIHFQLIIITSVSILTDPAYFVPPSCHCGILALRSRDFWEITLREKHVFGLFTFYRRFCTAIFLSEIK